MDGKDIFPEKDLLGKAATMERFEYSSLGRKLIAQIDISKKLYENLDDTYEFDKINENEKGNTWKLQSMRFNIYRES